MNSLEREVADKYEIEISENGQGHILKNGENMTSVKSFVLKAGVDQSTTITIEFTAVVANVSAEIQETTDIESTSHTYTYSRTYPVTERATDEDVIRIMDMKNRGII